MTDEALVAVVEAFLSRIDRNDKGNSTPENWEEGLREFLSGATQKLRAGIMLIGICCPDHEQDSSSFLFTLNANGACAGRQNARNHFLQDDAQLMKKIREAIEWGIGCCLKDRGLSDVPHNWNIQYIDFRDIGELSASLEQLAPSA